MDRIVTVRFVDIDNAENGDAGITMQMSPDSLPELNAKRKLSGIAEPVIIVDRIFYSDGQDGIDYLILYRR